MTEINGFLVTPRARRAEPHQNVPRARKGEKALPHLPSDPRGPRPSLSRRKYSKYNTRNLLRTRVQAGTDAWARSIRRAGPRLRSRTSNAGGRGQIAIELPAGSRPVSNPPAGRDRGTPCQTRLSLSRPREISRRARAPPRQRESSFTKRSSTYAKGNTALALHNKPSPSGYPRPGGRVFHFLRPRRDALKKGRDDRRSAPMKWARSEPPPDRPPEKEARPRSGLSRANGGRASPARSSPSKRSVPARRGNRGPLAPFGASRMDGASDPSPRGMTRPVPKTLRVSGTRPGPSVVKHMPSSRFIPLPRAGGPSSP